VVQSAEYVAPKSMTINVEDILLGAAIGGLFLVSLFSCVSSLRADPKLEPLLTDTRAVGVFIITLHHGKDLAAQDANGKSDPCSSSSPIHPNSFSLFIVTPSALAESFWLPSQFPSCSLSDIVAAYAKFGKPIYYTRVIHEDLNPVFEETLAVLLTIDEINTEESLSLMLWDSDSKQTSCSHPCWYDVMCGSGRRLLSARS
jgi:hypothetical protein